MVRKEHLGHLADLHALEERRLREFLASAAMLSAADPLNRVTAIAGHDHKPMGTLLGSLRVYRTELVRKLEMLSGEDVRRGALHPRLEKQMRIVDGVYFIA
jgi:hypothetical protein